MKEAILSLPMLSLIAAINGLILYILVKRSTSEAGDIKALSNSIRRGAVIYQKKQYVVLLIAALILATIITWQGAAKNSWQWGLKNGIAFMVGTILSLIVGFMSIYSSLISGEKLAHAFSLKEEDSSTISLLFKGGMLSPLWIMSLAFIGLGLTLYLFLIAYIELNHIISFSLGACFFALLIRIPAGLSGEVAESAIDLINHQKSETTGNKSIKALNTFSFLKYLINGIEGRGADFFDSLIASSAAAFILSSFKPGDRIAWILLPFLLLAAGAVSFLVTVYCLKVALRKNWNSSSIAFSIINFIVFLLLAYLLVKELALFRSYFWSIAVGIATGFIIILISRYYIKGPAINGIAQASKTGAATNIITGLASGMRSTAFPVLLLSGAVYASYRLCDFYGILLTAISLCSILVMASALNAWGSIAQEGLRMTSKSKSTGSNPLQEKIKEHSYLSISMGRGLSITAAAATSYALFSAFIFLADINIVDITRAEVVISLFIGAVIPFLVASLAIIAIIKVSNQLNEKIKMLISAEESIQSNETGFLVQIIKSAHYYSLKQVIAPALLLIGTPVCFTLLFGSKEELAGFLGGAIFTGILLAFFLSYGGTSWESTVQYIEKNNSTATDDSSHKASLVGRLIGNPLQEIAAPSMNILIKFLPLISLLLISLF